MAFFVGVSCELGPSFVQVLMIHIKVNKTPIGISAPVTSRLWMQALIRRGVIGDYRSPNVIRLGITPLYTRFVDIWDAVQALKAVMYLREWADPANNVHRSVT